MTPAAVSSTTLPLPPTSEYVDVEHRVCISFFILKLSYVLNFLLQKFIAGFQKLSAAPTLNYSPSTVSTDSKTSVPNTPSAKTRFQVQAVPNPPPATVSAQQANASEKKALVSNAAPANHSNANQARPQQMPVTGSSVTLEQLDSELRKVSGVQTDVASVVATGSPHLMHALSQSLSSANIPSTQHPNPVQAESHNQLADLNEKLALLTNKQHHNDHTDGSQSQQNPHRTVNALSRSGSVIPEDFGQSSASVANSAAGTASPSISSSTILHPNIPLESLNDLASALQRVCFN